MSRGLLDALSIAEGALADIDQEIAEVVGGAKPVNIENLMRLREKEASAWRDVDVEWQALERRKAR